MRPRIMPGTPDPKVTLDLDQGWDQILLATTLVSNVPTLCFQVK